jgi:hypothetical protein
MKNIFLVASSISICLLLPVCGGTQPDWSVPGTSDLKPKLKKSAPPDASEGLRSTPAEADKDLGRLFLDDPKRNQKRVGSCHTFASVAVLEAAFCRKYKKRIRFSEADLFYRFKLQGNQTFEDYSRSLEAYARGEGSCGARVVEGADPTRELPFAIKDGVALRWTYEKFIRSYIPVSNQMREADKKTLDNSRAYDNMNSLERCFFWVITGKTNTAEYVCKLNAPMVDKSMAELRKTAAGLEKERADYKGKLKGFTVLYRKFPLASPVVQEDAGKCRAFGADAWDAIMAELRVDRPVSVGMELKGLAEWGGFQGLAHALHAFTITGFSERGEVFHTRNSWDGKNPDVKRDQLCRVIQVASVLGPDEKPTPGPWLQGDVDKAKPDNKN